MCGLVGLLTKHPNSPDALAATAQAMAERITHRGPDDFGVWADAERGIALGHRRLSILDLSMSLLEFRQSHAKNSRVELST